jgi:uncharacterized membrane protein YedE/YeeE
VWAAVIGGLLLALGAFLTGGCDAIHGISGAATLSVDTAAGMLAACLAAVATAFAMDAAGALEIKEASLADRLFALGVPM